jgi:hypothetical protein
MRCDITSATNEFFRRQEELQIIDFAKQTLEAERKTREVRLNLAEGFLHHLGRAVRSYDNQVITHQFCLAFRILSNPVVERAAGYFCEKRNLKKLVAVAVRERRVLAKVAHCGALYHRARGWNWWRRFMGAICARRSEGIMGVIRRRIAIVRLFPYFNWKEVLPVKAPRPLREIEQMFKDLPPVSIQRKLARERAHHLHARALLIARRTMRDFFRAYAAFVQTQLAIRAVIKLMRRRQALRALRPALNAFKANWWQIQFAPTDEPMVDAINADICAWFKHFFRESVRQRQLALQIPYS